MVTTLQTKQTRLQGDEYLPEIKEREKREASLKRELAELKEVKDPKIGYFTALVCVCVTTCSIRLEYIIGIYLFSDIIYTTCINCTQMGFIYSNDHELVNVYAKLLK